MIVSHTKLGICNGHKYAGGLCCGEKQLPVSHLQACHCRHAIATIKRQVGWDHALKMQPSFKTSIESTEDPRKTVGNPIAVPKI